MMDGTEEEGKATDGHCTSQAKSAYTSIWEGCIQSLMEQQKGETSRNHKENDNYKNQLPK